MVADCQSARRVWATLLGLAVVGGGALLLISPALGSDNVASKNNGAKFSKTKLPPGFVRLAAVAPDIVRDMRYATPRNFTGDRVSGYRANSCILVRSVAVALKRVQQKLKPAGYGLKVYDCYRPKRAVRSFVSWAQRAGAQRAGAQRARAKGAGGSLMNKFYYPRIRRDQVIPLGYVAKRSSHSRGTAVDLTLVRLGQEKGAPAITEGSDQLTGSCIAPRAERFSDGSVDMGTAWDCFDVKSHTRHAGLPVAIKANRRRLVDAMRAAGFRNYAREWWHFSLPLKRFRRSYDFAVD